MEYGAIDLHKRESQVRIVTDRGEVLDRRIATTRERFTAVFEGPLGPQYSRQHLLWWGFVTRFQRRRSTYDRSRHDRI